MTNNYKDRIEVESLNIIGVCSVDGDNEDCHLCRQSLLGPSYDDINKGNLKIILSLGVCGHKFHKTCIDLYTMNSLSCPLDKTPWNLKEIISESCISDNNNNNNIL